MTITRDELIDIGAKAAFLSHWPHDKWEQRKDGDFAKETYLASFKAALAAISAAGLAVVTVEATGESIYAALSSSIAIMDEHKVKRLSPDDKGDPSPSLVARKAYAAMIRTADLAKEPKLMTDQTIAQKKPRTWMKAGRHSQREMEAACIKFNMANAIGTEIKVWSGPIEGEPDTVRIRTPGACILGGHTSVVYVTGDQGRIALSHVAKGSAP